MRRLLACVLLACLGCGGSSDPVPDAGGGGAKEPVYWPYDEKGPIGLDALNDLDALPRLRRGVRTVQYSSFDREGFNDSGFSGSEEFLYRDEDGATVLVDVTGPGVVYDLYLAWFSIVPDSVESGILDDIGSLQVFLDGATSPTIELRPDHFFDGAHPPFVEPFVFDKLESSYGTVSYLPIPFRSSCVIRLPAGPKPLWFHQIWVQRFRDAEGVPELGTPAEGGALATAAGEDPKDARVRAGNERHEGTLRLESPGAGSVETRAVVFESEAGGRIQSLHLRPRSSSSGTVNLLRSLWIEMEWDGAVGVEAPLALFFATGHRTTPSAALPAEAVVSSVPSRSLLVGEDEDGFLYSYFPMPFASSARISLVYRGDGAASGSAPVDVEYRVETHSLREGELPGVTEGYFRAQRRTVSRFDYGATIPLGDDYVVLETRGTGHYVGVVMLADDTQETFLEGDERIYVDGSRTPQIIGTATETFFQGGWYFLEKAFSLPLHGAPVLALRDGVPGGKIDATMYRLHPSDLVPFHDSIRFGIQHGAINNVPGSYETLAFYYGIDASSLTLSDVLDVGDPESEAAHGLSVDGASPLPPVVSLTAFYEGDRDGSTVGEYEADSLRDPVTPAEALDLNTRIIASPPKAVPASASPDGVTDEGRDLAVPHEFVLAIGAANDGVRLRRTFDQGAGRQRARVLVDGAEAGVWTYEGANPHKRWRDDDFEFLPELTRGKESIAVRIEPESGAWAVFRYEAFRYDER